MQSILAFLIQKTLYCSCITLPTVYQTSKLNAISFNTTLVFKFTFQHNFHTVHLLGLVQAFYNRLSRISRTMSLKLFYLISSGDTRKRSIINLNYLPKFHNNFIYYHRIFNYSLKNKCIIVDE